MLIEQIFTPMQLLRGGEVVEPARVSHITAVTIGRGRDDAIISILCGADAQVYNPHRFDTNAAQLWSDAFFRERNDHLQAVTALRS